jgi:hypothetical protein
MDGMIRSELFELFEPSKTWDLTDLGMGQYLLIPFLVG